MSTRSAFSTSGDTILFLPKTIFYQFLFLLTGVITTIGNQYSFYQGGAEKSTLIPVFFNFLGIALGGLIPIPGGVSVVSSSLPHFRLCIIGLGEVLGNMLCLTGLIIVGSGTYQIIYSSVVLFTALFARLILHKSLSLNQILALLVVSGGLALSALGSTAGSDDASTSTLLAGVALTLFGSMLYGLVYALSEGVMQMPNAPHPVQVQTMAGVWGFAAVSLYFMFHTLPNFQALVLDNIAAKEGSIPALVLTYFMLVASAFFHAIAYFELIHTTGSVSTGVLAALRAVTVFVVSSALFCDSHREQCYNSYKGLSTVFVMMGLIYYGYSSKKLSNKIKASHDAAAAAITAKNNDLLEQGEADRLEEKHI